MRFEYHHGHWIVCGHIFSAQAFEPGQLWQASGGNVVQVVSCKPTADGLDYWVCYSWIDSDGGLQTHEKDLFSFQCRYCLILDLQIPQPILSDLLAFSDLSTARRLCSAR